MPLTSHLTNVYRWPWQRQVGQWRRDTGCSLLTYSCNGDCLESADWSNQSPSGSRPRLGSTARNMHTVSNQSQTIPPTSHPLGLHDHQFLLMLWSAWRTEQKHLQTFTCSFQCLRNSFDILEIGVTFYAQFALLCCCCETQFCVWGNILNLFHTQQWRWEWNLCGCYCQVARLVELYNVCRQTVVIKKKRTDM